MFNLSHFELNFTFLFYVELGAEKGIKMWESNPHQQGESLGTQPIKLVRFSNYILISLWNSDF